MTATTAVTIGATVAGQAARDDAQPVACNCNCWCCFGCGVSGTGYPTLEAAVADEKSHVCQGVRK